MVAPMTDGGLSEGSRRFSFQAFFVSLLIIWGIAGFILLVIVSILWMINSHIDEPLLMAVIVVSLSIPIAIYGGFSSKKEG